MGNSKKSAQKKGELHYLFAEKRASLFVGIVTVFIFLLIGFTLAIPGGKPPFQDTTPVLTPTPTALIPRSIEYTLQENESLWDVAQRYYGDPTFYTKIALDNNFSNPDLIAPGTKLILKGITTTPQPTVTPY